MKVGQSDFGIKRRVYTRGGVAFGGNVAYRFTLSIPSVPGNRLGSMLLRPRKWIASGAPLSNCMPGTGLAPSSLNAREPGPPLLTAGWLS